MLTKTKTVNTLRAEAMGSRQVSRDRARQRSRHEDHRHHADATATDDVTRRGAHRPVLLDIDTSGSGKAAETPLPSRGLRERLASPAGGGGMPASPLSPWGAANSPSFKSLLSYAENPPQELVTNSSTLDHVASTWIGGAVRKEPGKQYFQAVARSDGFRTAEFCVGDDVMVLSPGASVCACANVRVCVRPRSREWGRALPLA